jgi:hypothetical protein
VADRPLDLHGLPWLVEARNQIQNLMLRLYKLYEIGPVSGTRKERRAWKLRWQWADGAAFSLWRAVFLIDTKEATRHVGGVMESGAAFLKQVIETNAITFADDRKHKHWTAGYYINNAGFRIAGVLGRNYDPHDRSIRLRDRWNKYFYELKAAIDNELSEPEEK